MPYVDGVAVELFLGEVVFGFQANAAIESVEGCVRGVRGNAVPPSGERAVC